MKQFRRWVPWLLIGWTVVLWVSRLRNVLNDDDLSAGGRAIRIGVVVLFVAFAVAAATGLMRGHMLALIVLVVWTIGYWIVRGGGILVGDWSIGFKVVHTVLMIISMGLAGSTAGWLAQARSRRRNEAGL